MEYELQCIMQTIPPPHFHVEYAGRKAMIDILNGSVIRGSLPHN